LKILYRCQEESWQLLGSDTIDLEISRTSDLDKNLKLFDSVHLACAEYAHVDVLLTTDKSFLYKAQQISNLHTKVENPVN